MQIVNTLTMKEIGSKELAEKVVAEKTAMVLATVVGRVTGTRTAQAPNKDGSFTSKMKGDFYAKRMDGEEFMASMCILPSVVHESVLSALADSDGEAEFALEIGIKFVEGRSIPYQFTVAPLLKPRLAAPLQSLLEKFIPDAKQLTAAPKATEPAKGAKRVA